VVDPGDRAMTCSRAHIAREARGRRRLRHDAGQTVTEYLMILGILTAIIIALTKMIAPAIADGMIRYMERRVIYNSSARKAEPAGARGSHPIARSVVGRDDGRARQGDVT
jgi:hypothetical protein